MLLVPYWFLSFSCLLTLMSWFVVRHDRCPECRPFLLVGVKKRPISFAPPNPNHHQSTSFHLSICFDLTQVESGTPLHSRQTVKTHTDPVHDIHPFPLSQAEKKRQKLFFKCGNPQTTVSCVCVTKNFRHQIQLTIAFFYRLEQIYQIDFEKNGLSNVFFDISPFIISVKELYLFFSEMSTVKLSIWCLLRSGLYRSKLSNSTLVILMHIKYQ